MQYSIIRYTEVIRDNELFRIDANFFHPDYIKSENMIKSRNWNYLGSIASKIINFGAYSLTNYIEYIENGGVPFLNVGDIYENEINVNAAKKIHEELSVKILKKSLCDENQVLLTIAGTIGNAAVVYNLPKNTNSNQAIANISISEISPFYLSVFLNSYYGKQQTARLTISSVQPNLLLTQVKNIKTFIPTVSFQKIIEELYKDSHMKKDAVDKLYNFAKRLLLLELGLENWRPKNELSFIKKFSDTQKTERFDAEYFQPKYIKVIEAIKNYSGGHDILGNLTKIRKSVEPGSQAYQDEGIAFVRVSNLSKFGIFNNSQKYISEFLYKNLQTYQPKEGEILLSKDATPGIAYHLDKTPDKMIVSSGILRLKTNTEKLIPEYLTLVLNSIIGQSQIEADAAGSVIKHWRPDQVKATLIPLLSMEKQNLIKEYMKQSFDSRHLSKRLIEIATEGVEKAIEQNESVAEQWIRSETEKLGISL